ncbi:MAG: GatB/YqeY domain-containing protein [Polyangiaceae bacterium]
MLLSEIKAKMFEAMKAGDTVRKEILRVAVGEITTDAAREGRKGDDAEAVAILKRLVKSNEETLGRVTDPEQRATLERELATLAEFLPKGLTLEAVIAALAPVTDALKAAGNDGQATGIAMKHLKATGVEGADGKLVSAAVKQLRTA